MIAVYPGSFDPVTYGHLDIIHRASKLSDKLIVAVLDNPAKAPLFTIDEKLEMLKESIGDVKNIIVDRFDGLLINYVAKVNADVIIRGLRAVSDYEYELQMALANKKMNPNVETMFMVSNTMYSFLSSSLVRELARFEGELKELVPDCVNNKLKEKFARR